MFTAARLRLTGWYLLILAVIVGVLSAALYELVLSAQQSELHSIGGQRARALTHVFSHDELVLAYQIIGVDLLVLLLAAAGAYLLAGRTLQPLEEMMERQRRFSAAASHELRTPLTALQGTLEVALLRRRTAEEYESVVRDALDTTEHMGRLVTDLTALARTEKGGAVKMVLIDLAEIAQSAAEGVRLLASRSQHMLDVHVPPALPVQGDPVKLCQVLTNLLANAIRYTPPGGKIHLVGRREHGKAVLEVQDTGIGIARKHLPHIFEPFYQVQNARSSATGHVGLGLALSDWIVRAHGGRLSVRSEVGAGSVFTLTLPLSSESRSSEQH